jgi:hypothetical protein
LKPGAPQPGPATSFAAGYPNIVAWIAQGGWIELGYEPHTGTCVRALDEGGMVWSGGRPTETINVWLAALEAGVGQFMDEQGLR